MMNRLRTRSDEAPASDNGDTSLHGSSSVNGDIVTIGGGGGAGDSQSGVPDMMLLNLYCARAKAPKETAASQREAAESWQPVREWLQSHDYETVRAAAEQRGESGLTALHFCCRNVPPADVIDVFLSIAADTVQWPDSFGWLPIHYACASGSDTAVIQALAENFPESKTTTDRRGRTPLHFALGDKPASPDSIFLLSSTGAASYPDEIGMLPLHYACAFGASEEVLLVLTDAYPEAITSRDKRHRTPLHFALSNAGRKTVPSAVRLLVSLDRSVVNSIDGGPIPLRVLAEYAVTIKNETENKEEKRESVLRCLKHLLNAEPEPTADFFTALQSLPDWLQEHAVVMPVVQNLLNEKISQRFPTAVLMLDLVVLILIIVFYFINVETSLELRFPITDPFTNISSSTNNSTDPFTVITATNNTDTITRSLQSSNSSGSPEADADYTIPFKWLLPLYAGCGYFALREFIQIVSLLSLKVFKLWLHDPSNYLNVVFVGVVLTWTIIMQRGSADNHAFRIGATISVTVLWVKLMAYLRNMLIDFAVFVGGVFYVVRRLAAFLISLSIILVAFSQMFYTVFQQTDYCNNQPYNFTDTEIDHQELEETRCDANDLRPYCNLWNSFLAVYTMLLGEVNENDFSSSAVATALFIIFMFLCVILLANVLIAIVKDSYKIIQDQKAAIVFWTNRLDFVAEMDAIANGPWKARFYKSLGCGDGSESRNVSSRQQTVFGKELWKQIMDLFEDEIDDSIFSVEFLTYTFLRVMAAVFIIPSWLILGAFTFGWLWPPQVREAVFTSTVLAHSSELEKEDELRITQVAKLQQEVVALREELLQELAMDRTQVVHMKSQLAERKTEIANEMKHIKRLVTLLFERQSYA